MQPNHQGQPEIWGLVHSGTDWVRAQAGARGKFTPLPASLVIAANGPGRLMVARGFTIARLQGGQIAPPSLNLLKYWVWPSPTSRE